MERFLSAAAAQGIKSLQYRASFAGRLRIEFWQQRVGSRTLALQGKERDSLQHVVVAAISQSRARLQAHVEFSRRHN